MRGINFPHVWYPTQTATAIPNIAATGANCVRLVLGSGKQWGPNSAADVAALIELCKANKLIAIVEVHDCTGFPEAATAAPMATAVDYWISIQDVLKGQEDFVIINIANEPLGNGVAAAKWVGDHTTAITRLRAAGFTHTLMVDGANWGQDWEQIMFNNAATVFNSDPLKNVIFSIHMYQVYAVRSTIQNYLSAFVTNQLPIVVGEFGADHMGQPVDEGSILEISQVLGVGYMGWSWSGNTGGTESLDITLNFNPATLSPWGTTLIKSFDGITATSQLATVFGDVPRLQLDRRGVTAPLAGGTSSVVVTATRPWTVTDNQPWISVTPNTGTATGTIAITATANPDIGPRTGTVTVTSGTLTRRISVDQVGTGGPGVCGNAAPITLPLVQNGVGDFCWVTAGTINSVNCWSVQAVEINGVNFSNKFSNVLPPRINGNYYIRYSAGVPFAHLEIAGNGGATAIPVTGVTLTPSTLALATGASSTLIATFTPANATSKGINWSSSAPAVASVNSSGAVAGLAAGTAIITATTQDGGFIATCSVTVGSGTVPVTGITLTPPSVAFDVGSSTLLTATVAPATATNKTVTWSSSNPAIATVSASGVVTGIAVGTVTITATTQDGGFVARSIVAARAGLVPVTGVVVSPATITLTFPGDPNSLTAIVSPAAASNKSVTWTSSNPAAVTVTSDGVITSVGLGTSVVTARTVDGGFTASSQVLVLPFLPTPPPQITVSPTSSSLGIGATATLTVTFIPANTPIKALTWTSSNPAVATVSSSTLVTGLVTGLSAGNAVITARAEHGGAIATATITVTGVGLPTPCANPVARTLPLAQNGAGDFCYAVSGNVSFINSWNMQKVEINGVDFTNKWSNTLPPRINGNYYIHYVANVAWAHLEVIAP